MKERFTTNEGIINTEQENAVFNNTLLLNGDPAGNKIIERIIDVTDIKRVIIFGEPGANKTTILLQLASELIKKDARIVPHFIFYDNALAKVKNDLGITGNLSGEKYHLVSESLTKEMEEAFSVNLTDNSRPIQFVELVGISGSDRGITSLRKAALRVKDQNPITSDTLVIGLAADIRSLKDAGKMRKAIAELEDPLGVFDLLDSFNNHLTDFPRNIPLQDVAKKIVEFFGKMATEERIEVVHREVNAQIKQSSAADDDRLFKMLRLPELPYPIQTIEAKQNYLWNAAFLQGYLQRLGLKPDMFDLSFKLRDKGLVIFSPYNPSIPKNIDLSKVLF